MIVVNGFLNELKKNFCSLRFIYLYLTCSDKECASDSNLMSAVTLSHLEFTPEMSRSFIPMVNWDRLASMYIMGRSGAECEAR